MRINVKVSCEWVRKDSARNGIDCLIVKFGPNVVDVFVGAT